MNFRRRWLVERCLIAMVTAGTLLAADSPVADAVMNRDQEALAALLSQNVNVNDTQPDGTSALHWAAHWEDTAAVDLLIRAHANVNAVNRYGLSPLLEAATNGNARVVRQLLDAGANARAALSTGQTALMLAARTGNIEALTALLNHGAEINAKERVRGQTALMWAVAERHPRAAKALIDRGADVNAIADVYRDQPKMGATQGIVLNGMTALHFAARQNDLESTRILVSAGARVDGVTADHYTALQVAVLNLHYQIAQYLLEQKADPNIADNFGRTPLYAVIDLRNLEISSRPSPETDIIGHLEMIRFLLHHGANPNSRLSQTMPLRGVNNFDGRWADLTGATPYLRATQSADLPVMRLLLANGADPALQTTNHTTGLMLAAGVGFDEGTSHGAAEDVPEAMRICIEHGDDVNAVNDEGYTALHGAAFRGTNDVVKLLVKAGARIDVKNKDGWSPETLALGHKFINGGFNRHEDTAALLRQLASSPRP